MFRLSKARADEILVQIRRVAPGLGGQLSSSGKGSSEVLVGLPVDDAQTAIDKRVEIHPRLCSPIRG